MSTGSSCLCQPVRQIPVNLEDVRVFQNADPCVEKVGDAQPTSTTSPYSGAKESDESSLQSLSNGHATPMPPYASIDGHAPTSQALQDFVKPTDWDPSMSPIKEIFPSRPSHQRKRSIAMVEDTDQTGSSCCSSGPQLKGSPSNQTNSHALSHSTQHAPPMIGRSVSQHFRRSIPDDSILLRYSRQPITDSSMLNFMAPTAEQTPSPAPFPHQGEPLRNTMALHQHVHSPSHTRSSSNTTSSRLQSSSSSISSGRPSFETQTTNSIRELPHQHATQPKKKSCCGSASVDKDSTEREPDFGSNPSDGVATALSYQMLPDMTGAPFVPTGFGMDQLSNVSQPPYASWQDQPLSSGLKFGESQATTFQSFPTGLEMLQVSQMQNAEQNNISNAMGGHSCTCGSGCQCYGCPEHPYNNTTASRCKELGSILEENSWETESTNTSRPPTAHARTNGSATPNTRHTAWQGNNHLIDNDQIPFNGAAGQQFEGSDQPGAGMSLDYMEFAVSLADGRCSDMSGTCRCGDNCNCVGCILHYGCVDGQDLSFPDGGQVQDLGEAWPWPYRETRL